MTNAIPRTASPVSPENTTLPGLVLPGQVAIAGRSPSGISSGDPMMAADFAALLMAQITSPEQLSASLIKNAGQATETPALLTIGDETAMSLAEPDAMKELGLVSTEMLDDNIENTKLPKVFIEEPMPDNNLFAFTMTPVQVRTTNLTLSLDEIEATENSELTSSAATQKELKNLASGLEALLGKTDPINKTSTKISQPNNPIPDETASIQLHTQNIAQPAPASLQASHRLNVATPLQSPQWSNDFGQQLVWMTKNNLQTAQLSINPPNLGPIEVTLTMGKEATSAHFTSPYADVREAIESALPRLREMLANAGVQLGQADVGAHSQRQFANHQSPPETNLPSHGNENATLPTDGAVIRTNLTRLTHGSGLIDIFA